MRPQSIIRIDREGLSVILRSLEFILGAPVWEGGEVGSLRVITKGRASSEFNFRAFTSLQKETAHILAVIPQFLPPHCSSWRQALIYLLSL